MLESASPERVLQRHQSLHLLQAQVQHKLTAIVQPLHVRSLLIRWGPSRPLARCRVDSVLWPPAFGYQQLRSPVWEAAH